MSRTIHELAGDDRALFELLLELDGEMSPEAEVLLEEHLANLSDKADGYAVIITELGEDAARFAAEAKRLAARSSARKNAAERLKDRLLAHMTLMQRDKLDGALFKIARQKNPASVELLTDDAMAFPDGFVRIIPETRAVDRPALLAALKANPDSLPNLARIAEPTYHLRIR